MNKDELQNGHAACAPVERDVMPSVEQTIEDCIARYPMLFGSRTEVLHHLFIELGCGFRWAGGALAETYPERTEDRIPRDEAREIAKRTVQIDNPYPWSDRCNLARIPVDILPDWKAAADEIRAAIPGLHNA